MSNINDFVIENGVLIKYTGTDSELVIPNIVQVIGNNALASCNTLQTVIVSEGVIKIEDYAFSSCRMLHSVRIADSVIELGKSIFYGCNKLSTIKIGSGVSDISSAFYSLATPDINVFEIAVSENNMAYESIDGSLYSKDGSVLIMYASKKNDAEFVVPKDVVEIGAHAFQNSKRLKNVILPEGLRKIGSQAFSGCQALSNVNVPNSVIDIGDFAFAYCESLLSVSIGDAVIDIGVSAFYSCKSLKTVVLPSSVTRIGEKAFGNCDALENITVDERNTTYKSINGILYKQEGLTLLMYPKGKPDTVFVAPDGVTRVADNAFDSCEKLNSITLAKGVRAIGREAFNCCHSLNSVTIPVGVIEIGKSAFWGCSKLTDLKIPNSVTKIGQYAFGMCGSLHTITIGDRILNLDSDWFYEKPEGLIIKYKNFAGVPNALKPNAAKGFLLKYAEGETDEAEISKYLPYIKRKKIDLLSNEKGFLPMYKFFADYNLIDLGTIDTLLSETENVEIKSILLEYRNKNNTEGNKKTAKKQDDFDINVVAGLSLTIANARKMWEFELRDNGTYVITKYVGAKNAIEVPAFIDNKPVERIENAAFGNCMNLKSVVISDTVTSIGEYAFMQCPKLSSVTFGKALLTIEDCAFTTCTSLKSITIPDSVISIGGSAFAFCNKLAEVNIGVGITKIGSNAFIRTEYSKKAVGDVVYIGTCLIGAKKTSISGDYIVENGTTVISDSAFSGCSKLKSIYIPDSVTSIGSRAFNGCKGIKSIKYRGSESQWENICKGNRWDQDMGKCVVNYGCNE